MELVDMLLGRPLATEEDKAERIGPAKGIPVFGLDALSSAAYGPEAALTVLIPLGMAGVRYIWPITISILILLGIVYFSYRQTISAYPQGGGSWLQRILKMNAPSSQYQAGTGHCDERNGRWATYHVRCWLRVCAGELRR